MSQASAATEDVNSRRSTRADHRSFRVTLEPPSFVVSRITKAVVSLADGLDRPLPDGVPMPVFARVDWQGFVPSTRSWLPLPPYSRPFPWDPHTLTPNADMAGLQVRAVAILADPDTDEPIIEYEGDVSNFAGPVNTWLAQSMVDCTATKRRARPRRYVSDPFTVNLSPELTAATRRVGRPEQRQFGFHCTIAGTRNDRLVVLVRKPSPPSQGEPEPQRMVVLEVMIVPDNDEEPMQMGWSGTIAVDGSLDSLRVCELHPEDDVTLTLFVDALTMASSEITSSGDAGGQGGSLDVVVKSAQDRNTVALCLRSLVESALNERSVVE